MKKKFFLKPLAFIFLVFTSCTDFFSIVDYDAIARQNNCLVFVSNKNFFLTISGSIYDFTGFYYSTDLKNWNQVNEPSSIISKNNCIYLKGISAWLDGRISINISQKAKCYGNLKSLYDQAHERYNYSFYRLFYNCENLLKAPDLPANCTELNCVEMFYGCKNLQYPPKFPAEFTPNYSNYCNFTRMFYNCESLLEAPELPSGVESINYYQMFSGCKKLKKAPELNDTKATEYQYAFMFENCTSLKELPVLSAIEIDPSSYAGMFRNCTNIKLGTEDAGKGFWKLPDNANNYTTETSSYIPMFSGTGGDFTGFPIPGTTYYYQ